LTGDGLVGSAGERGLQDADRRTGRVSGETCRGRPRGSQPRQHAQWIRPAGRCARSAFSSGRAWSPQVLVPGRRSPEDARVHRRRRRRRCVLHADQDVPGCGHVAHRRRCNNFAPGAVLNGLAVMIVGPFLARSVRTPRCRRVATRGAGFARPDRAGGPPARPRRRPPSQLSRPPTRSRAGASDPTASAARPGRSRGLRRRHGRSGRNATSRTAAE
jgi:hypothetical protein